MKYALTCFVVISSLFFLPPFLIRAQEEGYRETYEMSPLERSYKQRYDVLSDQLKDLKKQIGDLQGLKNNVDYLIDTVQSQPTNDSAQSLDKYNQLQSLLPVGVVFSQDLQRKEGQMSQVIAKREALKEELLRWRGSLPFWWND